MHLTPSRGSKDGEELRGEADLQGFPAQVRQLLHAHLLRGFLQRPVGAALVTRTHRLPQLAPPRPIEGFPPPSPHRQEAPRPKAEQSVSSSCCCGRAEAWLLRGPQGQGPWGLQTAGAPGSQFQGLPHRAGEGCRRRYERAAAGVLGQWWSEPHTLTLWSCPGFLGACGPPTTTSHCPRPHQGLAGKIPGPLPESPSSASCDLQMPWPPTHPRVPELGQGAQAPLRTPTAMEQALRRPPAAHP